jgi:hypothetical protein
MAKKAEAEDKSVPDTVSYSIITEDVKKAIIQTLNHLPHGQVRGLVDLLAQLPVHTSKVKSSLDNAKEDTSSATSDTTTAATQG